MTMAMFRLFSSLSLSYHNIFLKYIRFVWTSRGVASTLTGQAIIGVALTQGSKDTHRKFIISEILVKRIKLVRRVVHLVGNEGLVILADRLEQGWRAIHQGIGNKYTIALWYVFAGQDLL